MDYLHNTGLDRILDDMEKLRAAEVKTLPTWQGIPLLHEPISAPQPVEPPGTPAGPETPRKTAPGAGETGQELEDPERFDGMG